MVRWLRKDVVTSFVVLGLNRSADVMGVLRPPMSDVMESLANDICTRLNESRNANECDRLEKAVKNNVHQVQ